MSNDELRRWEIKATKWDNPKAEWRFHDSEGPGFPGYDSPPPCIKVMRVEDHERIVAELKAEIETLGKVYRSKCPECGYSGCVRGRKACDAEIDRQKETIATQKRVIEKLKLAITDIANKNTCWRLYEIDKYKSYEDGWEGVAEFAGKVLNELEAIEKGEA